MNNYFKIFYLIFFIFLIKNVSYANDIKIIKEFREKYGNVNMYYGKWVISGYEYEKSDQPSYYTCSRNGKTQEEKEKYVKIENEHLEKSFSDEVGKIITISKNLYEYPYYENLQSNYLIYKGEKYQNLDSDKRDYTFFDDGKCGMQNKLYCYKIDNPDYKIVANEESNKYATFYGVEEFKDLLYLYIYYDSKIIEYFVIGLKEDNQVIIFKTFGDKKDKIIIKKYDKYVEHI